MLEEGGMYNLLEFMPTFYPSHNPSHTLHFSQRQTNSLGTRGTFLPGGSSPPHHPIFLAQHARFLRILLW